MLKRLTGCVIPLVVLSSARPLAQEPAASAPVTSSPRTFLKEYCITCHNERLKTASLLLDVADIDHVSAQPEIWEKVVRRLRSGTMPPIGRPRPATGPAETFVSYLETELDRGADATRNPGPPTVHRLNRAEYTNVIRDLLGLEIDSRMLLPPDTSGYGFDNVADVLSVSPGLLERYMSAATHISRLALGDSTLKPTIQTYKVAKTLVQLDRVNDDLPFGSRGGAAVRHYFPLDGEYVLKIRLRRNAGGQIRGLAEPNRVDLRVDGNRIGNMTIGGQANLSGTPLNQYLRTADDGLEVRFAAKAGVHVVAASFVKSSNAAPEGLIPVHLPIATFSYQQSATGAAGIDSLQINGPFNATASNETVSRRILICRPSNTANERTCATTILARLARRAYRRPVTDADVAPLLRIYESGRAAGTFEQGIQMALENLLVDPEFLFRIEGKSARAGHDNSSRVNDFDLASRLSFFLWSSIPDDELLDVAARGKLVDPVVLERQVRRMIASSRASALVKNFGGQWLQIRNLEGVTPDPNTFPDFDDNLRDAFERETYLFLENEFREDRSISHLLTADYTFLNERLARHYEIPNVYGNHFRRVTLTSGLRGGLLGHGSVLTVTSYSNRTSPVLRGKFLLANILGFPPSPPPPNVSDLAENSVDGKPRSVRERLEQHRRNPACSGCHAPMDPLGFALENFDGVGRWRTSDAGTPVDSSGVLPDGTTFSGPLGLRKVLDVRRRDFTAAFAEKLLTYALGRGLEYYDRPALREILQRAAADDYRWSSLILNVIRSTPFQARRVS